MKLRSYLFAGAAALAVLVAPLISGFSQTDFSLNQFFIYNHIENPSMADRFVNWRSAYSLGWQRLSGNVPVNTVDYKKPADFFDYLFKRFPSYAVVYPTETYYYYTAPMADGTVISGNMRLLDAQDGILHIGYFDKNDPHNEGSSGWAADFGPEDGVSIKAISEFVFDVTYQGRTIRFSLSDFLHESPKELQLLAEEEFVSQIQDESGMRFFLLYNNKTASFYYLLNEENGVNETVNEFVDHYLLGSRTNYVYYYDRNYNRKILVGLSKQSIYNNDYYDGPFDQVPPRLPIKEKLEAAYPYVKYRGGIDAHGNFVEQEGSRVAISPYFDYENLSQLKNYLDRCTEDKGKSVFWSCLTYETKKDFHKTLEAGDYPSSDSAHAIYVSQGWPANHSGEQSLTWPEDHIRSASLGWIKDHNGAQSSLR